MDLISSLKAFRRRTRIGSLRRPLRAALVPFWRPMLGRVRFIAIAGSCGKTTAVSLLSQMLGTQGATSTGVAFNTMRGVNRTIVSTSPFDRWCVQELSGHIPGHIKECSVKLKPKVGIITMIGTDHLSNYRTPDAIAHEKGTLVELLPADGTAYLNADDPRVLAMRSRTKAKVVTYGLSEQAMFRAIDPHSAWPGRLSFTVLWQGSARRVQTQLLGEHWVTPILAALACALGEGVPLDAAIGAIENFSAVYSRTSIHVIENGPVFVVDTAKAPYGTIDAVIAMLASAEACRKTLVLGNISDYAGSGSPKYRRVARDALAAGARVVGIGRNAYTVRKLKADFPGRVFTFDSSREARDFLAADALPGELILLKSASSGHIERIMLSWASGDERCWIEECGRKYCKICPYLSKPQPVFKLSSPSQQAETVL